MITAHYSLGGSRAQHSPSDMCGKQGPCGRTRVGWNCCCVELGWAASVGQLVGTLISPREPLTRLERKNALGEIGWTITLRALLAQLLFNPARERLHPKITVISTAVWPPNFIPQNSHVFGPQWICSCTSLLHKKLAVDKSALQTKCPEWLMLALLEGS